MDIGSTSYNFSGYYGGMQDLRSYSASDASSYPAAGQNGGPAAAPGGVGERWEFQKGNSVNGVVSKSWSLNDPELQRKKRVAGYKAYTVEGKMKGSIKKSFKWLRERYTLLVHGHI
ncbi:hypothetical protein STAS_10575 [Striga asiatica]|uniref:Uncharacterized protein n=1 Tax=Striga asiatica TaxID=4170 RepID=A0A5A7PNK1_STRAF|nr:hypothetical protein STAS_10575 [Striga asiatica]